MDVGYHLLADQSRYPLLCLWRKSRNIKHTVGGIARRVKHRAWLKSFEKTLYREANYLNVFRRTCFFSLIWWNLFKHSASSYHGIVEEHRSCANFLPPSIQPYTSMHQVHDYRQNNLSPRVSQGDSIQFNRYLKGRLHWVLISWKAKIDRFFRWLKKSAVFL